MKEWRYSGLTTELPDIVIPDNSETKGALETLQWAYDTYGDKLVYACSFAVEGSLLIHLISQVKPNATVVFLDTGLHFAETYDVIERTRARYPELNIVMQQPAQTVEEQNATHGDKLWETEPNKCCALRKIEPLRASFEGKDAWISGLRREQGGGRVHTNYINVDHKFEMMKICPLIHWTWKEVWRYAYKHDLPYHKLHDFDYPSIGCEPCTASNSNQEDMRAGRWSGSGKRECGLHG
ncbi:MAG: phosphoadenylyl-sulfate reductase [Bacilli bacterium]